MIKSDISLGVVTGMNISTTLIDLMSNYVNLMRRCIGWKRRINHTFFLRRNLNNPFGTMHDPIKLELGEKIREYGG